MNISNSKFHKCWEAENKGNFTKIKFGDSKKNKDGTWTNCTWSGILVGKAHEMGLGKDDKFNIISGQVFQDKVGDKYYTNTVIFEIEFCDGVARNNIVTGTNLGDFEDINQDNELPF